MSIAPIFYGNKSWHPMIAPKITNEKYFFFSLTTCTKDINTYRKNQSNIEHYIILD